LFIQFRGIVKNLECELEMVRANPPSIAHASAPNSAGSSGGIDKQLDNKQYEGGGMVTEKEDAVGEIEGGGFGIGMVFISCNGV
jgi:hypothetical protein